MALIACPECKNMISDRANACPHCGLPAEYFYETSNRPIEIDYANIGNVLISFDKDYLSLFKQSYISSKKKEHLINTYSAYFEKLNNSSVLHRIKKNVLKYRVNIEDLERFIHRYSTLEEDIAVHNSNYVEQELEREKEYFDNMLKSIDPNIVLDDEQRRAVIIDDDYCLLVAGAGAGKTTTMAAKVKYLVEKKHINPEEIIVISYTNKAIEELKERINQGLGIPVKICTFHKLAFDLVRDFSSQPPDVNINYTKIILDILEKTIFDNKPLLQNLVLFLGYYFNIPEEVFCKDFSSLNQYHEYKAAMDYKTLKSDLGEYIKKVEYQRTRRAKTLTGEHLRSAQEVQIANFLYLNGIDYEYEAEYPCSFNSKKKYTPDFTIRQGEHVAYLEHYALTENGKNNRFTPKQLAKYKKSINDKIRLHKALGTTLLNTWSAYNDNRPLIEHLKEILENEGFILKQRNFEEVYEKIVETSKDKYIFQFINFLKEFIEHYKTLGYHSADGFELLRKKTDNPRTLLFLDIAEQVYNYYQSELKRTNKIDFADMINDANFYLRQIKNQHIELSYKYIIIDEFQDIARQRFDFTKRLSEITKAKVVAVGDDWQSIFAFAGSDISLFTKFIELMGSGIELKITHTYRNSQQLIDIAGNFVQKNSSQIKKQLISPKRLENPVQIIAYNDTNKPMKAHAEKVEEAIGKIIDKFGIESSILLLGRFNFDFDNLVRTQLFEELPNRRIRSVKYPNANIHFMTAHSSKGLGYDNVVMLNIIEDKFGFPCQIEDDPIMKLVVHEDTTIPFAEERRLFYVALTRTKNYVYIITSENRPSRFLIELIKDANIPYPDNLKFHIKEKFRLRCPVCNYPLKQEFNKNYGLMLFMCTNEPEICDFMTNSRDNMYDIFKCPKCADGYMIVRMNQSNGEVFYGCTNFNNEAIKCNHTQKITTTSKKASI